MAKVTLKSYRKEREKEILNGLVESLEKIGALVERQAKINVSKSPPEHPRVQTGRLRASIIHQVEKSDNPYVEIGTNVYYSKFLEFGTSRMPAYPWLYPAIESNKGNIKALLKGRKFGIE